MAAKPQPIFASARTVKKDLHGTPETAPPGEEPADRAQFDPYSGFPVLLGFRVIFAHNYLEPYLPPMGGRVSRRTDSQARRSLFPGLRARS